MFSIADSLALSYSLLRCVYFSIVYSLFSPFALWYVHPEYPRVVVVWQMHFNLFCVILHLCQTHPAFVHPIPTPHKDHCWQNPRVLQCSRESHSTIPLPVVLCRIKAFTSYCGSHCLAMANGNRNVYLFRNELGLIAYGIDLNRIGSPPHGVHVSVCSEGFPWVGHFQWEYFISI